MLTCRDRSSQWRLPSERSGCKRSIYDGTTEESSPSFDNAPKKKKSQSVNTFPLPPAPPAFLRLTRAFFNCSNTVYWITGLATSTSAGPKPRKNAAGPSVLRMWRKVSIVPSLRGFLDGVEEEEGLEGVEAWSMPLTA